MRRSDGLNLVAWPGGERVAKPTQRKSAAPAVWSGGFMKRSRRFLAVATVGFVVLGGVAHADSFNVDGDALTAAAQSQTVAVNLAPGGTTTKTVGAYIESQGGANSHVTFPVAVTLSITNNADGILSNLTSSAGNITAYGVANELPTTVTVTAPSTGLTCGVDNLFTGKVRFESAASNLSPPQTFATINLTVAGPACSSGNAAPVVEAGGPYGGNEGAAIALNGGSFTDAGDSTTHTYLWAIDSSTIDSSGTCSLSNATSLTTATITCDDNGAATVSLTVTDGASTPLSGSDTASVTIGNAAPVITGLTVTPTGACSAGISSAFTDAGSNDTHDSSVNWGDGTTADVVDPDTTPVTGSHTYSSNGVKTITVTVNDDDDGSDSETGSFTALNTASLIQAPINTATGTPVSVFKAGSTVPIKITVTGCDGLADSSLTPTVQLAKIDSVPASSVNEAQVVEAPTNGKLMRWSETQYIYNLSTKRSQFCNPPSVITGCTTSGGDLTAGSYKVWVTDASFYAPSIAYFDLK
jgi:hypothetical protein